MSLTLPGGSEKIVYKCDLSYRNYNFLWVGTFAQLVLLLGSLANTHSEGTLGSPRPHVFMAVTLNSYSDPSMMSLTGNFLSEDNTIC